MKLEEILATKMRCLLQRKHIADLYDLAFPLLLGRDLDLDRTELVRTFFKITIFGASPGVAKALLVDLPLSGLKGAWTKYISAPLVSRFSFDEATDTVRSLVESLLPGPPIRDRSPVLFPASLRYPIMEAAEAQTLLRLRYDGVDRLVEPYSLAFRTRQDGLSREYLYAFDTTGGRSSGPGIKTFVPDRVSMWKQRIRSSSRNSRSSSARRAA